MIQDFTPYTLHVQQIQCYTFNKKRFNENSNLQKCLKNKERHPHPSHSSKQRDEHDHTHELSEEDEWSEEGPHRPQCYVKTAREGHTLLKNIHKLELKFDDKLSIYQF